MPLYKHIIYLNVYAISVFERCCHNMARLAKSRIDYHHIANYVGSETVLMTFLIYFFKSVY